MSVGSGAPFNEHTGNGVAVAFAYGFTLLDEADLVVEVGGVATSAYSVSGLGNTGGGTVTMDSAPASGASVLLKREIALTRSADYQTNGDLQAATLNDDLDRLWMAIQGVSSDVGSALRSETPDVLDLLPGPSSRANKLQGYDSDGQPVLVAPTSGDATDLALQLRSTDDGTEGGGQIGHSDLIDYDDDTVSGRVQQLGVTAKSCGAVGDGNANDYAAILAMLTAHKNVLFTEGTYHLGDWSTSDRIFDLTARGDGLRIETEGDVEFTVNTTANVNPVVFYLRGNNNSFFGRMKFRDLNYSRADSRGIIPFTLDAFGADWRGITFDGIKGEDCYTPFVCATQSTTRVRGIHIKQLIAIDCNRGANFQNQGDDVVIDQLYCERVERAYFAYGVTGHRVNIFTRENYGTTGSVNIARAVGGYDTTDIRINYHSRDNVLDLNHVLVDHIDLLGGTISGIKVHMDIRGSTAYDPARIVNYTGSGGSETTSASSNNTYDIELSGSCDAQARPVEVVASFASKRSMTFTPGRFFEADQSLYDAFFTNTAPAGAAAAWDAPTPPAIGNGNLSRSYFVEGGSCTVYYSMLAGSTTTFGTGDWTFQLPFPASQSATGAALILDTGTGYYTGTAMVEAGSSDVTVYPSQAPASTAVRSTTPMTWATGDQLQFSLTYRM